MLPVALRSVLASVPVGRPEAFAGERFRRFGEQDAGLVGGLGEGLSRAGEGGGSVGAFHGLQNGLARRQVFGRPVRRPVGQQDLGGLLGRGDREMVWLDFLNLANPPSKSVWPNSQPNKR